VNDIPGAVSSTIRLYADDVLLYINSAEDCDRLQRDFSALCKWAANWKMTFNATKCYCVRFTKKKQHTFKHTYHINNYELEECDVLKYLEVFIDNKLTWSAHTDYKVNKANRTLSFLVHNFKHCSPKIKLKCYLFLV